MSEKLTGIVVFFIGYLVFAWAGYFGKRFDSQNRSAVITIFAIIIIMQPIEYFIKIQNKNIDFMCEILVMSTGFIVAGLARMITKKKSQGLWD